MSVCSCHGVIFPDCPNVKAGRSFIATKVPDEDEKRYTKREVAAREAKLIADTRLAVVEYCEQRIKECAAIRHGEKPAPHSTEHAVYFDQEKNRFEESFAIKFRDAILALTPAHIAAQAEERDRRVIAKALKEYEDDFIHISEYWNGNENDRAVADALWEMRETVEKALKRLAAHRAAVQPGG